MSAKIVRPSILSGFMELKTDEQLAFNKLMEKIRKNFELFGFAPIDTPIIEKAEILTAKSGGDTEKQMYEFEKGDTELALRFDLTVPLARYIAQYKKELRFPFKRYQIGKVYRGEKPQKGRFREFYQCDIDIVDEGSLDLINDAEIAATIYYVFKDLEVGDFVIYINNRKLLGGFMESLGLVDKKEEIIRNIDKLDKIGPKGLLKELKKIGLSDEQLSKIIELTAIEGNSNEVLESLEKMDVKSELFETGLKELKIVAKNLIDMEIPEQNWKLKPSIARGLDYYTGTVYETYLVDYSEIGSVCSGGRYDDLASYFTKDKFPGVGVSIGLTRLFDQLNQAGLIKKKQLKPTKILLTTVDLPVSECFKIASVTRNAGIPTEIYYSDDKFSKKLDYANKIGVPFVGIVGSKELENNAIAVKDMASGEQEQVNVDDLGKYLLEKIE